MKKRIYLWGFVCILLCVLFSVPAYADESSQNLETESVPEIASTSAITISPADNFVKIEEQQQYTCVGATGTPTWSIRDSHIATVSSTGLVTGVSQGQTYLTAYVDGVYITATIKVGAIEEGTYFIANRKSGLYMDLEAADFADGTPIQQWEFHGEIQSRWIITMESTGYYSIRSALTNKYIGVENSSTSGGAAIKQYSSIANQRGRQWSIIETPRGAYRFKPNTATHMGLSIPVTNEYDNGTNLVQLGYANDSNYRDEWYIGTGQIFIATVNMYYDHGYHTYYNETETASKNKLNSYIGLVSDRYYDLFNLVIHTNTATYYSSIVDICKTTVNSSNISTSCSSTNGNHNHCTVLFDSIHNHFRNTYPGNTTTTSVYWSGHLIETEIGSTETNRCYSYYEQIYMITRSDASGRDEDSCGDLMHELNHQYGAIDHYHEPLPQGGCRGGDYCATCGTNSRPTSCIMNNSRQDINSPSILCSGCRNDILAHLNNHHNIG